MDVTNYHHFPQTLSISNSRYRLMTNNFHNNSGRSAKTIMPTGRETQKENNEEKGIQRRRSKTEKQKEG
jgi:hypothetical protein